MQKTFNPKAEIAKSQQLLKTLKELDPFIYRLFVNAQFASVEQRNKLLEKTICNLREINESFKLLADDHHICEKALEKYNKLLKGFVDYLYKCQSAEHSLEQ